MSATNSKSILKYGAIAISFSTFISSFSNMFIISCFDMFVPNNVFILSTSNFILFIFCFVGYTSIFPSTTSPAPKSSTNSTALFIALNVFSDDSPFS